MIALADVYHVVAAIVPLYVAMIAAYLSVKWQKLFTPDQCSGINKFVAKFSVPLLSFQVVSTSNPYKMSLKLIFSDAIQKLLAFLMLAIFTRISSRGKFDWIITGLSISTLPNTLILGIPLLRAMYGDEAAALLGQIVVLQSMVWYNLLLFLFELNAVRAISITPPSEASGEMATAQGVETKQECENRDAGVAETNKSMLILSAIGRKLMSNPNTHATILGLIWACIHFRWGLKMPEIVDDSISILAKGGLGMAMFSLGLFMASRGSLISCRTPIIILTMGMKFLVGPVLMAVPSFSIGLRGTLFRVAIMQAALPQGIVPFVFAREYNVHPDIVSTGVIFGLLIAVPVALGYYFLLAL